MMMRLIAVLLLAGSLPVYGQTNEEDSDKLNLGPACTKGFYECIEDKRAELQSRGSLGMFVHVPHSLESPAAEHISSTHSSEEWFIQALPPVVGPAEEAGLREGDRILKWNGQSMPDDLQSFKDILATVGVGDAVVVTTERNGQPLEVTIRATAPDAWQVQAWLTEHVRANYSPVVLLAFQRNLIKSPDSSIQ